MRGVQTPVHVGTAEGRGEAPEAGSVGSWTDTETEPKREKSSGSQVWLDGHVNKSFCPRHTAGSGEVPPTPQN